MLELGTCFERNNLDQRGIIRKHLPLCTAGATLGAKIALTWSAILGSRVTLSA
jgi:hypothetical protein